VSNDPLNLAFVRLDEFLNHGNSISGQRQIRMHTPHPAMTVRVLSDALLSSYDPAIVTTVTAKVNPFVWTRSHQQIDVSLKMARRINHIYAPIVKEVDSMLDRANWLPLVRRLLRLSTCKIL
jgi:hypothetical protein